MRLRFFIFLLFMVATVARSAVPVYKNDTLTLIPTNLLRTNILDSATVTWSMDTLGRLTPTVIGGNASNAQPPSANLTNWSTVSTQALRVAKTVFVSTNGNNATGAREWIHLPFASPKWAKTNAVAGDTIVVYPGSYDEDLLAKNDVNWMWLPGAGISRSIASTNAIWSDIGIGAVTSIIAGGAFKHSGTGEVVRMTNSATVLSFKNIDALWQASGLLSYAVIRQGAGTLTIDGITLLRCDGYDGWWIDGPVIRSIFRGNHVAVKDTVWEVQHNFTRWGDAYFEFNTVEQLGAGTSTLFVLGDKSHVKGSQAKLAPATQITTLTEATEGGIIEIAVIEAATNASVSPILAGDDLLGGGIYIKNSRIIGPTFGDVPPVNLFLIGDPAPVTFENVELVAGAGSTYSLTAAAGNVLTIKGGLRVNKALDPDVAIQAGALEYTNKMAFTKPIDVWGNANVAGTLSTTNLAVTNRVTQKIQALAYSGTNVTIDLSQGNIFFLTATNNVKFWPTNGPGAGWSQQVIVHVDMDGTGGYSFYKDAVTSETNYTSLVLTNTANAKNTLFVSTDKTGTNFQFLVNPGFLK